MAGSRESAIALARAQGIFYVVTGIWPILSMRTFECVTGPKTDRWLVKTAGALIAVIGGTLVLGARRGVIAPELRFLGGASAASLAVVDLVYALRGRISKVYLLDAAVEIAIVAAWMRREQQNEPPARGEVTPQPRPGGS
jgi:hypothetical protein